MPYPTDPTPSGGDKDEVDLARFSVEAGSRASIQQLLIEVRVARELLDVITHLAARMDERLTAVEDALAD